MSRVAKPKRLRPSDIERCLKFLEKAEGFKDGVLLQSHALDIAAAAIRIAVEGSESSIFKGPDVPDYDDSKMEGG
jgi:hypothetical protein